MWEVSWRRRQTATYWPKVLLATIAALLPHLGWAAQPWVTDDPSPLSGADSHSAGILSPTATRTELELNLTDSLKPSVAPGYIIVWHTPASCGRTHLHRIQPRPHVNVIFRYFRLDAPVIYTGASLHWRLGRGSICSTAKSTQWSVLSLLLLYTLLEFFTSTLVDGFSLEFEWQPVSSSFQGSSQYSGRLQ